MLVLLKEGVGGLRVEVICKGTMSLRTQPAVPRVGYSGEVGHLPAVVSGQQDFSATQSLLSDKTVFNRPCGLRAVSELMCSEGP